MVARIWGLVHAVTLLRCMALWNFIHQPHCHSKMSGMSVVWVAGQLVIIWALSPMWHASPMSSIIPGGSGMVLLYKPSWDRSQWETIRKTQWTSMTEDLGKNIFQLQRKPHDLRHLRSVFWNVTQDFHAVSSRKRQPPTCDEKNGPGSRGSSQQLPKRC